jgi:hypothetical protein
MPKLFKEGTPNVINENKLNLPVGELCDVMCQEDTHTGAEPQTSTFIIDVTPKREKLVSVRTQIDHRCCIGGVFYTFEKNVEKKVPEYVKMTLRKQNLLRA